MDIPVKKENNVDSRFQIQLEEDGLGSTRQSWMETSHLWLYISQLRGRGNRVVRYRIAMPEVVSSNPGRGKINLQKVMGSDGKL